MPNLRWPHESPCRAHRTGIDSLVPGRRRPAGAAPTDTPHHHIPAARTTRAFLSTPALRRRWTIDNGRSSFSSVSIDEVVNQCAPAVVTRGLPIPEVDVDGDPPFVIASRHPNGAVAVGALGRMSPEKGYRSPEADVTLHVGDIPGLIGIFGNYRSLTLVLDNPLPKVRIWGQDLAGDKAVDISEPVAVAGNGITRNRSRILRKD